MRSQACLRDKSLKVNTLVDSLLAMREQCLCEFGKHSPRYTEPIFGGREEGGFSG